MEKEVDSQAHQEVDDQGVVDVTRKSQPLSSSTVVGLRMRVPQPGQPLWAPRSRIDLHEILIVASKPVTGAVVEIRSERNEILRDIEAEESIFGLGS